MVSVIGYLYAHNPLTLLSQRSFVLFSSSIKEKKHTKQKQEVFSFMRTSETCFTKVHRLFFTFIVMQFPFGKHFFVMVSHNVMSSVTNNGQNQS